MHFSHSLRVLLFVFLGHFCVDFMIGIWPVFKTMVGMDLAVAGVIAASCAFVGEGMQFVFGSMADRGYQRALILVGIVVAGCSAFLPFATTLTICSLLYLGTCIASGAFHPTANALLGSLELKNRNVVMGLFTASGMLGLSCSQISFTWAATSLEGKSYMLVIPPLFLAALAYIWLPKQQVGAEMSKRGNFSLSLFWKFLQDSDLRTLYFIMISNQIASWAFLFLLPDFLKSRGYEPWIVFGGGHMYYVLGAVCMPPLMGYLADHSSRRRVISMLAISSATVYAALVLPWSLSTITLFMLLFLLGGCAGSVSPLIWSHGNQLVPNNRGMVSAFLMGFAWMFSETVGIAASGQLATYFVDDAPAKSLACMGTSLFATIFFAFKMSEERGGVKEIA